MSSITLQVPESYCPSKFYIRSDPKEIAIALSLGEAAFEALNGKAVALARSQTHLEAVASVSADFSKQIEVIQTERTTELKRLTQEKLRLEETCKAVQARLEVLETQQSLSRAQVQKETKESYQELLLNKEKQIENLQQTLERQMEGMGMKMEALHNSITRTFASSKEKGSFGEILIEGMLKKAFDCDIHIISKDSQTADIRMVRVGTTQPTIEYLWEVKNYTRTLTTEEVEKFRRDMRLHPEVRGGFLASLRTGIVGKSRGGDIDIEFLEDGRFIVFLSNLMSRDDVVFYLQTLRPLLQIVEEFAKPVQTESDVIRTLEMKSAIITNLLRGHSVSISKHKNSLVSHQKRMDQMFAEFKAYLMESDTQLQNVLRIAIGTADESAEVERDAETYLPALVYKKERLSDLDGRLKAFTSWLLTATEVREGTQIKVKDLLDQAKEKGFAEKFVRDTREELFQPVAWALRSQYILGLQWKDL
jgi:hypothetical protein